MSGSTARPLPPVPGRRSAVTARRRWSVGVLAAAGLFLSACGAAPLPEVSFYGNGAWTTTAPARWCVQDEQLRYSCPDQLSDVIATLTLGKGQGVQIGVPREVSDQFWVVYITYLDADGVQQAERTPLFRPDEMITYRALVKPGEQILEISVRTLIPTSADELDTLNTWVLAVTPAKAYVPPVD